MSRYPAGWAESPLWAINEYAGRTIDPSSQPQQTFELYSVPAFPSGVPERLVGVAIGSTKQTVGPNDVLVCKINPRINRVWRVAASDGLPQIASSEWIAVRNSRLDPRYLRHYFTSPSFRELICDGVTGVGGSLTRAQPKRVAEFSVPVAPLGEQRRIADKLDALLARVDACRDRLDRVPGILKRFRQSVLSAAMSGGLSAEWRDIKGRGSRLPAFVEGNLADVPQDAATFSLPTTWRVVQARDVVEPDAGIVYGIVQPGPKLVSGIRYVQITDIVDGRIQLPTLCHTSEEIANGYRRSSIRGGDVLLGIIRALKVAVVPAELDGANISRSVARMRPREGVLPEFLAYALQSPVVQDWLRSQHRGMDMPVLNLSEVRLAPIPIAPTDEQAEIVRRVESLLALADAIEARYAAARAQVERLTPALLSKAFRGELVPQDPNDEPASALLARLRDPARRDEAPPTRKPGRRPARASAKEPAT